MTIKEIQTLLKNKGFDPGEIDGIDGPKTQKALAEYGEYMLINPPLFPFPTTPTPVTPPTFDENTKLLIKELERDEGRVLHAYQDHLGYWTIGIGRLIDKRKGGGITNEEADYLKRNDIVKIQAQLDQNLSWWRNLDPVRQRAIQNMCFQLGIGGLLKFKTSLALIKAGDWPAAGRNLRQSLWYDQTPERAERVVKMIEKG